MKTLKLWTLACGLLMVGTAPVVYGLCDQSAASQADRDLWGTHDCWSEYFLWQYRAYALESVDWTNMGWDDACNVSLEYPKHWNASYLLTYGLLDDYQQSFHATADYRATAEAVASNFHEHFKHMVGNAPNLFGSFDPGDAAALDVVTTHCPLYSSTHSNGNPASRAGDFMHEGWHAWLAKYDWDNGSEGGHRPGPLGTCTTNGCDYFYFHGISEYVFGDLWTTDGTAARFHSPNQVQVEFLCDIGDLSQSWVPASVGTAARADANARAAERFINGPGYACGDARPW